MILENPIDPRIQAEVDPTHQGIRASLRPLDHSHDGVIGGHFKVAVTTGLTTIIAAADSILSLRWTNTERHLVLARIQAFANIATAFGTAQEVSLDLVKVTGFSGSDSGGTSIALGSTCRKGPGMQPSRVGDLRVATTAALTLGTGTADANPLTKTMFALPNTLGLSAESVLFDVANGNEHPVVLEANEGLRIRIGLTQGAAGVVRYTFVLDWAEVPLTHF